MHRHHGGDSRKHTRNFHLGFDDDGEQPWLKPSRKKVRHGRRRSYESPSRHGRFAWLDELDNE